MDYYFECIDCGRKYKTAEYVCPSCAVLQRPMESTRGVLKVVYDPSKSFKCSSAPGMGRYIDLLPIKNPSSLPPLQVGTTPLYKVDRLADELGLKNLYIKNDTGLPTGSFKDRASALVVAKARELKKDVIVCASTGNAASALAGMCASVGMKCVIYAPASAPMAKLTQILVYGAKLIKVDGTYDDAFELSLDATRKFGWYNRNTAYNPFTMEGKKTVSLEIWEQLGKIAPDKIFVPVGDGAILAGVYKGFWDLLQLGLIDKLPQLIAVQAKGSCAIVNALNKGVSPATTPPAGKRFTIQASRTIADSICVNAPRNLNWAVKAIKETNGFGVTVSDKEIIAAIARLGKTTGVFAEPAAAAAAAGLFKVASGKVAGIKIKASERVVLLTTGTGLKDIPAAIKSV